MSEQTDAAKKLIVAAKAGDKDAMAALRKIGAAIMSADDGSVPETAQIAVIEYIIRLQDDFQEAN